MERKVPGISPIYLLGTNSIMFTELYFNLNGGGE